MPDPLAPATLLSRLPTLLPQTTSSPLPAPTDSIAALVHAIHISLGFRYLASAPPSTSAGAEASGSLASQLGDVDIDDTASETPTAVEQEENETGTGSVEGRLSEGWNGRRQEAYSFEYRHEQSAMIFRIRVGRMGGRVQIDGMAEDGEPHTISIPVNDLLTTSSFPIPGSATAASRPSGSSTGGGGEDQAKSLGFTSVPSVKAFVDKYVKDVVLKLLPGLQVEGLTAPATTGNDPRNRPPSQPDYNPPARPSPLIDPLHPQRGPGGYRNPASVGHRDLDPLASLRPPGSFNPHGDGGGMYMDFNHPLFDGRRGGGGGNPDFNGPGGSIQPPGSRWDPVGPSSGGFPGVGGNPLNGVGRGDRDWGDELAPPGEFGPDLRRDGGGGGGRGGLGGGFGGLGGGFGGGGRFGGGGGGGAFGGGGGGMYM